MSNDPTGPSGPGQQVPPPPLPGMRAEDAALLPPGLATWDKVWKPFVDEHEIWWRRMERPGDPVYTLPEAVIDVLAEEQATPAAEGHRATRSLITEQDAEAERAFRKVCEGFSKDTVGVWMGRPIKYPFLGRAKDILNFPDDLIDWFCRQNKM